MVARLLSTALSGIITFPLQFWDRSVFRLTLILSSRADVSRFFRASCIPGAAALAPSLCTLCQGEKSYSLQKNYHCETSHSEPFYNSQGALRSGATNNAHLLCLWGCKQTVMCLQMSQEWACRCCICGPFSSGKYWRWAYLYVSRRKLS